MFQCAIVCFSIKFSYVADKWLHRPPSLQRSLSGRRNFSLYIFGKHTLVQQRMIMLFALGQCALQYHSVYPTLFSSVSWGNKEATAKGRRVQLPFTTSHGKWQLRPCSWKMSCRQRQRGSRGRATQATHLSTCWCYFTLAPTYGKFSKTCTDCRFVVLCSIRNFIFTYNYNGVLL